MIKFDTQKPEHGRFEKYGDIANAHINRAIAIMSMAEQDGSLKKEYIDKLFCDLNGIVECGDDTLKAWALNNRATARFILKPRQTEG